VFGNFPLHHGEGKTDGRKGSHDGRHPNAAGITRLGVNLAADALAVVLGRVDGEEGSANGGAEAELGAPFGKLFQPS